MSRAWSPLRCGRGCDVAQYWLDIHTDPRSDAEILALFELINTTTSSSNYHTMTVVTKDGLRALRIGRGLGTSVALARLVAAGSPSSVDIVARMEVESVSTTAPGGLACYAAAVQYGTANWYCGYSTGAGSVIGRQDLPTAAPIALASGSSGVDQAAYHYRRFLVSGDSLSQKVWSGSRGDEPGAWLLTASDSTYSGGWVGVASRGGSSSQGIVHLTQLAIGTDGDPAPTGPVGGERQRSRLILTPW